MRLVFYLRSLYLAIDWITGGLIYFAVLFGPWAFGTTQTWSIDIMNGIGIALGSLWLCKRVIRLCGYQPAQWTRICIGSEPRKWLKAERRFTWLLAAGTLYILLYCLISAVNARAVYHPDQWSFEYRKTLSWLPHSYDQESSWASFWKFLGLAGLFWALRDWLLTLSLKEVTRLETDAVKSQADFRLPARLRSLFCVLAVNGTVLAIQGLMQRAEGGNKLLWLVVPSIDKAVELQFGPYAYRANAAQYFNLLWPAVLGFWWASVRPLRRRETAESSRLQKRLAVLLPCVFLMAVCPLVASSRGGAIVLMLNLIVAGGILLLAQWRSRWKTKALIILVLAGIAGAGGLLGWKVLGPRMETIHEGYEGREGVFVTGHYMERDNPWFGTGPGTFATMYQLYRRSETEEWAAYMHDDWLETLITFGRVGATPVFLMLIVVLLHWFRGAGIYGNKYFVILLWVSLGGCLIHACYDFPFQIHSVLTLFLVICAVLSCLSRRLGPA
jgi:O-antigen ligase